MLLPRVFGEDLFDDFFGWDDFPFFDDKASRNVEKKLYGRRAKNLMKTDIRETDTEYELTIDLPGFKKEEVHASLENGYLTISAQKNLTLSRKILHTSAKSIRGRLLSYLSDQAIHSGSRSFTIPFDRQRLADYLNVDRSALSNELSKMRREGLLRVRKNHFELLDAADGRGS